MLELGKITAEEAAEKAKIELSNVLETDLNLPFITADASGPKHLTMKLSRATLDNVVRPIVERCKASVDQAMSDAKLTAETISKIILVGGPTRMPIVQKFVEDHVGKKVERGIDPMECVAIGAGKYFETMNSREGSESVYESLNL